MEKRRNTLDRFQRLGFGRKSSNIEQSVNPAHTASAGRSKNTRSSEKSEKLKELTELLRGTRVSPTPPPVPPPRKPRSNNSSSGSSLEKPNVHYKEGTDKNETHMINNLAMIDQEEIVKCNDHVDCSNTKSELNLNKSILNELSIENRKTLKSTDCKLKSNMEEVKKKCNLHNQKGLPFRSASFSQIDLSHNTPCKNPLVTLRERLQRGKAIDETCRHFLWHRKNKEIENKDSGQDIRGDVPQTEVNIKTSGLRHNISSPETFNDVTMDSLTEKTQSESETVADYESQLPLTVESQNFIVEDRFVKPIKNEKERNQDKEYLANMLEEKIPLESPPDNFLQTATTCLIPVPVFECAAQEWRLECPPQEWVEVIPEQFDVIQETVDASFCAKKIPLNDVQIESDDNKSKVDKIPIISMLNDTSETRSSVEIQKGNGESASLLAGKDGLLGKRRYSHDDMEIDIVKGFCQDPILARNRNSHDERKRIDKSRRRKGVYIDSEDWNKCSPANKDLELNIKVANSNCNESTVNGEYGIMYINSPNTDDSFTPGSINSLDLNSTDFEYNNNGQRKPDEMKLSSLSCQSSEEKEEYQGIKSLSDNELEPHFIPQQSQNLSEDVKLYTNRRPLRGPYGQMLEAEMKKPNKMHYDEIIEDITEAEKPNNIRARHRNSKDGDNDRRVAPKYSNSMRVKKANTYLPIPTHTRAASTPSQVNNAPVDDKGKLAVNCESTSPHNKLQRKMFENCSSLCNLIRNDSRASSEVPLSEACTCMKHRQVLQDEGLSPNRSLDALFYAGSTVSVDGPMPTEKLLAALLKGSSENIVSERRQKMLTDTRTHIVQEIFKNEQSYVDSLQTVINKYLRVLKSPEHAGMIDTRTVDEIFFMVPDILEIHEKFLLGLKSRLDNWSTLQKVGDTFVETFSSLEVLEVYTSFVNNCNRAKNAIRTTKQQRPSFAKFLEITAREHKGKLTLDNLLIKPVQKFPNYEMLFQRLIKHTEPDHPDQKHLQEVLKLVHDILVHINCKEREILENGQREATLRELENVIEGITDLITPDRQFLLFDLVSMPSGQGARKERGFFLFNDLLVLTSIKKRSGTIRKPNTSLCPGSVSCTLDSNKYKFLTKISLDCLEIVKNKDDNVKRVLNEVENLVDDCNKLQQITEIVTSIKYSHQYLEDAVRDLYKEVQRQLSERQANDAQLNMLELAVNSPNGSQKLSIVFSKAEKRTNWEETFMEAKQKLAATLERHPIPEFLSSIPIRKTRAGLQFTCAAATLSEKRDVWVCNSDGYVGQVCIMSLYPEPNVTSCNGVCNARILCVASVPAYSTSNSDKKPAPTHNKSFSHHLHDSDKNAGQSPSKLKHGNERKKPTTLNTGANMNLLHTASEALSANNNAVQLDLNLSSSDEETDLVGSTANDSSSSIGCMERTASPAHSLSSLINPTTSAAGCIQTNVNSHVEQDASVDDTESNQSTMWIGTEDGCIHIYNSTDNIRIKKNRIKIEHHSAVYSILYMDNRVFVALANGDMCVYLRDGNAWNTTSTHCLSIGTVASPVTKLLKVHEKLWCAIQGIIKVLDVENLVVTGQIQISSDSKPITNMTLANNYVWISIQNSAHIKCFHSLSLQLITEVNLAPAVNKMLSNCDEIIRQHKAACLRVTSLLSCKDLVWIGTSAGVLLTIPAQNYDKSPLNIIPTGIPHGHTGHVRFLTFVETNGILTTDISTNYGGRNTKELDNTSGAWLERAQSTPKRTRSKGESTNMLIISGGDGYEDFRNSGANSLSEIAGREDSTNHLLIWQI